MQVKQTLGGAVAQRVVPLIAMVPMNSDRRLKMVILEDVMITLIIRDLIQMIENRT